MFNMYLKMFMLVFIVGLFVTSSFPQSDSVRDGICREYNTYYRINGSCDSYVQCDAHKAIYKTCPDGLHFLQDVKWPQYPCAYPSDAECDFSDAQEAMPACKHKYGLFVSPLASRSECGKYRMCIEGKPLEMECSIGLAFNPETGRCDWPELVPICDVEAFLGFKCPPATYEFGKTNVVNFGIEGSCRYFFSCMKNVARLQICDTGYVFDESVSRCVDASRGQCWEEQ